MKKGFLALMVAITLLFACVCLSSCMGEDVEGGVIYNGVWAIGCEGGATEITLREGTVGIKSGAFSGHGDITRFTIPDSVTTIMQGAFDGCDGITTMVEGVRYVDGWAISASETVSADTLLDGTRGIADEAFYDCAELVALRCRIA